MEKLKKDLKLYSLIVLLFAALTLVKLATEAILGMGITVSDGAPAEAVAEAVAVMKIVTMVVVFIMLIPQFYTGFKGLSIAKNPDDSKGHIVWAKIIFVFCALSLISCVVSIIQGESFRDYISTITTNVVEMYIYFEFIRRATAVYKECQIQ